jgi:hypothetical protein
MVISLPMMRHYEKYSFIVERIFPKQTGDVNWPKGEGFGAARFDATEQSAIKQQFRKSSAAATWRLSDTASRQLARLP